MNFIIFIEIFVHFNEIYEYYKYIYAVDYRERNTQCENPYCNDQLLRWFVPIKYLGNKNIVTITACSSDIAKGILCTKLEYSLVQDAMNCSFWNTL